MPINFMQQNLSLSLFMDDVPCGNVIAMKTIAEIRRDNVRLIMSARNQSKKDFAENLDIAASQLSHIVGKNYKRNIGDDLARDIERKLSMDIGWLDNVNLSKEMGEFIDRIMRLNKDGIEFMAVQLEIAESIISRKTYQDFSKSVEDKRTKNVPVKLDRRITI